ncbi:MAG TPA: CPBP family intramembrane glutamic endopeptidase [Candidatus Sulfopaludibacter sp.]|nr:CPBP family intramembrane glutamic endopeptidase [Candidatus Sulfopaludibacter sp.]
MTETMPEQPPIPQTGSLPSQFVRCIQVVIFVGIWMAIGWLFRLGGDSYLVVGVPLVVIFQLLVRKKPLVTLWVRDAERFRLNPLGILLGLCLAILPTVRLVQTIRSADWSSQIPEILWYVCCIIGAFGAAFGFCRFVKQTWKELGFCLLTAGAFGSGTMVLVALARWAIIHKPVILTGHTAAVGIGSFVLYVPVCFALEEVVFRGALDSHVFRSGDKGQWWTAFFISALWGWWHLPIAGVTGRQHLVVLIFVLPCIHIAVGVFFSLSWRRSGNLAAPATVHAFIDAVRNMLM